MAEKARPKSWHNHHRNVTQGFGEFARPVA